jgi:hypothetical protein
MTPFEGSSIQVQTFGTSASRGEGHFISQPMVGGTGKIQGSFAMLR